jgi:hypothetical protein
MYKFNRASKSTKRFSSRMWRTFKTWFKNMRHSASFLRHQLVTQWGVSSLEYSTTINWCGWGTDLFIRLLMSSDWLVSDVKPLKTQYLLKICLIASLEEIKEFFHTTWSQVAAGGLEIKAMHSLGLWLWHVKFNTIIVWQILFRIQLANSWKTNMSIHHGWLLCCALNCDFVCWNRKCT